MKPTEKYYFSEINTSALNGRKYAQFIYMTKRVLSKLYNQFLQINIKTNYTSWLVWLSGLSAGLQTKVSQVRFPVRAHAWAVGQDPRRCCMIGNNPLIFLSLSLSPLLTYL